MKRLKKDYVWIPLLFLGITLLIPYCVHLATTKYWGLVDLYKMNEMGDAMGGTTAPFIGLMTGFLTFIAFWVQYKFNKNQMEYIKLQTTETKINSLNHTFDIITRTAPTRNVDDLKLDVQMLDYTKYLEKALTNDPHSNVSSVGKIICDKDLLKGFNNSQSAPLEMIYVGKIFNYLFTYARFISSLEISHLKGFDFESRKQIISDYMLKIISIIQPEYHHLFSIILVLYCKKSNHDLTKMLSPIFEDTQVILKINAKITK